MGKRRGFEDIRANINGYQTPIAYNRPQDGQLFIPDVTGKQMGRKSYFEVVLPTDDQERLVSKLKLLSLLAANWGGNLYVMGPKSGQNYVKKMVAASRISAEIIDLR